MKYQTISMKQFFPAKGAIYDVAIAMEIFSHVKITCYFHVRRYHVFARKFTWYFIGVYRINGFIWLLTYSCRMPFYCWHSFLSSSVPYLDKSLVSSNSDKTTLFTKKTNPLFEWSIFLLGCYNVSQWNKSYGKAILVNSKFLERYQFTVNLSHY